MNGWISLFDFPARYTGDPVLKMDTWQSATCFSPGKKYPRISQHFLNLISSDFFSRIYCIQWILAGSTGTTNMVVSDLYQFGVGCKPPPISLPVMPHPRYVHASWCVDPAGLLDGLLGVAGMLVWIVMDWIIPPFPA